ncbi:thioredoxin domain-containing protein [Flavihumibacter fluvii]|uniref:thioredoxin domain-containing protein n=1 Tax=Flavihumibacter fluvii TaxID=2838157 RepID=UPI001BDF5831|nr:thioredoxin domain-containing protein [Flavihumibacter fluvii]ULQ52457.1 thioredoxin domain-containing protein [Flavihumibacter fluvii]
MPNRLAKETSPYLLQHAHNPVDWYPWGEEALNAAKMEEKPILVSIGYAACHWCHVMERESFEDPEVANLMNTQFINIKIDREERPDLDHIYMDAIQAMTGSGGWPLNVFLTPAGKPFYGGTYFPPSAAYNRPSWTDVLQGVANAWRDRRGEISQQAENMVRHLEQSNQFGGTVRFGDTGNEGSSPAFSIFHEDVIHQIATELLKNADKKEGGFGKAPKFPQTSAIEYLLHYAYLYKEDAALEHALISLNKMIRGGIYDQIGGGFARYSTDNDWLVPHFEKMLYDQALLLNILADAYAVTKNPMYSRVIHQTMDFIQREMLSPDGGFYAALDADSEGEEGKFYVWEKGEIDEVLGLDAPLANDWFGITAAGNWEGINILTQPLTYGDIAGKYGISEQEWENKLAEIIRQLMSRRSERIRPGLDDKQILSWNAMMNMACSKVYQATGRELYRQIAVRNMNWILEVFTRTDGGLFHTYKQGIAKFPAFLDDYAYLVQALIYIQEITGEQNYLDRAKSLMERIILDFGEEGNQLFYYTFRQQKDIVVRKREVYDGAQPSGNAVMVLNLHYLGLVFDRPDWKQRALEMLETMGKAIVRYPISFGCWGLELFRAIRGVAEIVLVGQGADALRTEILANFIPFKVFQSATHENNAYPLLRNKPSEPDAMIFVCQNYSCRQPVASVKEMLAQL